MRRRARKGLLRLVRAPHTTAHDDVEAGERLAVGLHDDHAPATSKEGTTVKGPVSYQYARSGARLNQRIG